MIKQLILSGATGKNIRFIGATEVSNTATLSLDASAAAGDFVLVVSMWGGALSLPNLPTGYTGLQSGDDEVDLTYRTSRKLITSDTEVTGLSDDMANSIHAALVFRGVNSTPIDATTTAAYNVSGMPKCPAITTTKSGMVVLVGCLDADMITAIAPSGYTLAFSSTVGSGTVMVAYKSTVPGTYDPDVFGGGGNDTWWANTISLRAA